MDGSTVVTGTDGSDVSLRARRVGGHRSPAARLGGRAGAGAGAGAGRRRASMLVVASRGNGGLAALLLGSVSRHVAFAAKCPVVVAREETVAVHREIVVGVRDLDQPNPLGFAFEEARLRRARLHVVYAWELFLPVMCLTGTERPGADVHGVAAEAARWLADLIARWRQKYPDVAVIEDSVHAPAGRILVGASAWADLLILGRNGPPQSGNPGASAVAHAVLHHAHCPVAIIPE